MEKALAIQRQVIEILGIDEVYLVGGSVRDLVMGNEPKDYDFCTPMLPDDIEKAVEDAGRHAYSIGKKFGTIGFKVEVVDESKNITTLDGNKYNLSNKKVYEYVEVTTFRSEVYTSKSRKPEVAFVPSLEEDLARRDFTINAMVLKPDGSIYDPYGGRIDILAKLIKTVGKPKDRIIEDPLRILRAARFSARYNFEIDPNFIGKARQLADRIYDVSIERWVQELDKLFVSDFSYRGTESLFAMGIWNRILPEVYAPEFKNGETVDEAWKRLLQDTGKIGEENSHISVIKDVSHITQYINSGICQRLKFSNDRRDIILNKKKKLEL